MNRPPGSGTGKPVPYGMSGLRPPCCGLPRATGSGGAWPRPYEAFGIVVGAIPAHSLKPAPACWGGIAGEAKTPARLGNGSGCAFERGASGRAARSRQSSTIAQPRSPIGQSRGFGARQGRPPFRFLFEKRKKKPRCALAPQMVRTQLGAVPLIVERASDPLR